MVLLGLLQEHAQRVHVLRDLTVRQSLPCARSDLEFADHRKIRQSRHPSPVTITVNISWTMDVVRQVDAGLTKHDGVQFDLTTPDLVSEGSRKGVQPMPGPHATPQLGQGSLRHDCGSLTAVYATSTKRHCRP
jgi:hypothetical protein